ncbi:hypothetical protein BOTBODRAFT_526376 [Botryobasidium botryosum FD-172 SS1]|uniref:Uncharacterized protein n=1 Tax=Botryobasidium botryosum (strain FD-172 SS1) TaxID=930990 RepID=A0A067MCX5_BOTB1|nr:hypothetical protein BOTBODRAFT_526376 [Botryobasidium botryosum FD-172 SS1]
MEPERGRCGVRTHMRAIGCVDMRGAILCVRASMGVGKRVSTCGYTRRSVRASTRIYISYVCTVQARPRETEEIQTNLRGYGLFSIRCVPSAGAIIVVQS